MSDLLFYGLLLIKMNFRAFVLFTQFSAANVFYFLHSGRPGENRNNKERYRFAATF